MSTQKISIISHTYGRAEYLKSMIESVRATTPADAYEVIVVVSDPPETEKVRWLKQQPDVVFIQGDIRRPWQLRKRSAYYYINLGMKRARYEWVVVFNDDMAAVAGWHEAFASIVSDPKNANLGMIVAAMHLGKVRYGRRLVTIGKTKKPGQGWKPLPLADMAIMRRDTFERIGWYDEKIDWAGGGADLALSFEFLTDTDILTTEALTVDHHIAKEGRSSTATNDFTGYHYIYGKWDAWCAHNDCAYILDDPGVPAYTPMNRVKDYLRRKLKALRQYSRWIKSGAPLR